MNPTTEHTEHTESANRSNEQDGLLRRLGRWCVKPRRSPFSAQERRGILAAVCLYWIGFYRSTKMEEGPQKDCVSIGLFLYSVLLFVVVIIKVVLRSKQEKWMVADRIANPASAPSTPSPAEEKHAENAESAESAEPEPHPEGTEDTE